MGLKVAKSIYSHIDHGMEIWSV